MTEKDEWLAYLESQQLDRLETYVRRLRPHVGLEDEELKKQWIVEFKNWAANFGRRVDHGRREHLKPSCSSAASNRPSILFQMNSRRYMPRHARKLTASCVILADGQ
jgi:hypothetical protein